MPTSRTGVIAPNKAQQVAEITEMERRLFKQLQDHLSAQVDAVISRRASSFAWKSLVAFFGIVLAGGLGLHTAFSNITAGQIALSTKIEALTAGDQTAEERVSATLSALQSAAEKRATIDGRLRVTESQVEDVRNQVRDVRIEVRDELREIRVILQDAVSGGRRRSDIVAPPARWRPKKDGP